MNVRAHRNIQSKEKCTSYALRLTYSHKQGNNLLTRENISKNFHEKIDDRRYGHTQETRVSGSTPHPQYKLS